MSCKPVQQVVDATLAGLLALIPSDISSIERIYTLAPLY